MNTVNSKAPQLTCTCATSLISLHSIPYLQEITWRETALPPSQRPPLLSGPYFFWLTHFLKARIAPFCSSWVSTDGLVVTGSFCSGLNWDKPMGELERCMAIRGIIILGWLWILAMLDLKTKHIRRKVSRLAIFNFQGWVAQSMVSFNHWLSSIKTNTVSRY